MVCCCGDSAGFVCGVPVKFSAWLYYLGFLIVTIISWVLRDYGGSALEFGPSKGCLAEGVCGDLAVLRLSFGSLMFFGLMLLLTLGIKDAENPRLAFHIGLWPIKYLVWGALIGCTFAMPNSVLEGYLQGARVLSAFFILLQLVILLDFLYQINEWLLEREACAFVMVSLTALMVTGSITGMAFLYKFWAPSASCSLNIFFITSTFLLFLLYGGLSMSPWRVESAGLMTSAAMFAYCVYFTWSALTSEPVGECTPTNGGGGKAIRIISFVLAMLVVGVSTTNSGRSSASFSLGRGQDEETARDDTALAYRPDFFHLTFLLASAYLGMVLIGWGIGAEQGEFAYDKGWGSVWAKMAASWACAALYTWSLVAHKCLPGREF